jgi:hypothetical protein
VKCYWEREETIEPKTIVASQRELYELQLNPKITITNIEEKAPDVF